MDQMDIMKALESNVSRNSALDVLMQVDEYLDTLNVYAYPNWFKGEIVEGPEIEKYWVTVTLMYPYKLMPDPDAALRLKKHGARVFYGKDVFKEPKKIMTPDDLEPTGEDGKRRPKRISKPIWLVTIEMPRQFVSEFDSNKITINGMDIDTSEVEGAYDSDYDNEMNPDKQELGVD